MELQVNGCKDCPMLRSSDFNIVHWCNESGNYLEIDLDENKVAQPITPSWCPLKTEPIIITLKEN